MIEQLSPIQEHYLKRELVRAQISYEVQQLLDFKSITSLGPPFADSDGTYHDGYHELPIMTHIFNAQVQTFPFINSVNQKEFWQDKVQTFVQSLAQKDLSSSADRSEDTKRRRIGRKLTNLIALYMGSGLQTTTPMEKTACIQPPAEKGVRNIDLEKIVLDLYDAHYINDIDVNVVGVRIVSERHGFLYEDHAEFIIKAQFRGAPPVHVARRYSEFRKLQTQLEKEFPGKQLPSLPSRNKTATILSDSEESDSISIASEESDHENESVNRATPLKKFFYGNKKQASTYPREKQRITLRSYLRALLRNSQVAKSQSLLEFFFRDRFKPSLEELKDMDDRRRLDIKRIEDQIEFYKIATERARILEIHMSQFKQDLMAPGGLQNIFSEIREKDSVDQLSPKFQKFLEWAEIEVGGTLYNMFVADDSSPELFSQVSRIHKLVPYTLLRAVLRVSNPMAIMKGVIDLFLAQPLGRRSLLQNILIMVLADDIKTQEKAISEMKKKINNPSIVASFEAYINASYSVKEEIRARDSALIVSIVNSPMISQVPPEAVMEIEAWYAEWNRAVEGERIENSEFVDCFSNLTELFKLMVRKRDKDQIQNLWDEASTMGLVKNLFTIFYGPLVEVFRSAKVHEAVGDFEKFMSDLMRVVRAAENNALASDPNQMVQDFYELCQRHVPALFKFIHQVYVHDNGLFDEIMKWISGIMDFLRNGNGKKIDLNEMCRQGEGKAGIDIAKVQRELDSIVSWIDARRKWREKQRAHKKSKNDNAQAIKEWQDALPTKGLDGTAFGLDENDLEEVDDDDDESDLEDEDADADADSGLTAVEQERRRRARLLQRLEQQAHTPVRPEITELPKLLRAISCLKGIDVSANGCLTLPEYITRTLGIHCGALSGANLAPEIAEEKFSETTVAYRLPEDFQKGNDVDQETLFKLFHRPYFHVNVIDDVTGICLAGALKNVVAIAAGFVDGKNWGDNAKAAIMRRGLLEMVRFGSTFFADCNPKTFTEESAGVADLITSCAGGRNLRIGREFARTGKSLRTLETELLNGQSAQGIITAKEVYEFLSAKNALADFPLLVATYNIAYNGLQVSI